MARERRTRGLLSIDVLLQSSTTICVRLSLFDSCSLPFGGPGAATFTCSWACVLCSVPVDSNIMYKALRVSDAVSAPATATATSSFMRVPSFVLAAGLRQHGSVQDRKTGSPGGRHNDKLTSEQCCPFYHPHNGHLSPQRIVTGCDSGSPNRDAFRALARFRRRRRADRSPLCIDQRIRDVSWKRERAIGKSIWGESFARFRASSPLLHRKRLAARKQLAESPQFLAQLFNPAQDRA